MATLSDKHVAFLKDKNFAVVATLGDDGTLQTSTVWVDTDGENVLFNTVRGRAKVDHLEADPRVSVIILNHENPYSWLAVAIAPRDKARAATFIDRALAMPVDRPL